MTQKIKEDDNPPPPLCVWCSAPWTNEMLKVSSMAELESGYYGDSYLESIATTIDIKCSSCKRLVYRKEIYQQGNYSDGVVH